MGTALADPRLAPHLDTARSVRVRMRTSVLTLVVIAPRPETAERALAAINALHQRHPSRAIVVVAGRPRRAGARWTRTSTPSASCPTRTDAEMCTEQILSRPAASCRSTCRASSRRCSSTTCRSSLWWPDDPPFGSQPVQRDRRNVADRLLVDSGTFHEDGGARLAGLADRRVGWRGRH